METNLKVEDMRIITMPIFGVRENEKTGKKLISLIAIINYGKQDKNGMISYLNRDGFQKHKASEFDSCIKLFKFDEICLDYLMSDWQKFNKNYKPIILDESINTQEVYKGAYLQIMVERREDCVAIRPLFEKIA